MGEVIRAEWFDLANNARTDTWTWMHEELFPALQAAPGVAWVGHYDIVKQHDKPYIEGAPMKKTTTDTSVPTGWENVVLTAATSPEVFFGDNNAVDALLDANKDKLSTRLNYRSAVFIEEQVINSPEQRACPYGMGPPPAMQLGNYNCDSPEDEFELARWYRSERFARVSVSRGMIRGRKMISMVGWPKHGVLWEFTDLPEGEFTFEPRFIEADRGEEWHGRHVLEYVTHSFQGPHCGRRIWPTVK